DWPEVQWNISGLFIRCRFLTSFLSFMKSSNISHVLKTFHDAPDVLWNGGRLNMNVKFYDDSAEYFKSLNDKGVGVFLTVSNLVLEEKHLDDPDSNRLVECLDEKCGMNGVIVANDLLSDYLRKKKPGLKQVASVVKSFIENPQAKIEWYKEMQSRYDRVVVHTDHMFDLDLLDKLDRTKTEILINEECAYKCQHRQRHQTLTSKFNIDRSKEIHEEMEKIKKTVCLGSSTILDDKKNLENTRSVFLTHCEVKAIYDMGFRDFKICGRRKPVGTFAWYLINFIFNPYLAYAFADMIYRKIEVDTKKDVANVIKRNAPAKSN
ncbi:MAG: hypothetical protein PHR77_15440, partial [Kiritimatiellae bacterium]|nr:hypothetical protein [Kiritimatiellia bacterium]